MVLENGFRDEVIQDFSNRDAKILFMNGQELSYILENRISLNGSFKSEDNWSF